MADETSGQADRFLQRTVLEGWLSAQSSANTRAAYRSDLETFGRWCAHRGALPVTADTATLIAFQTARKAVGDSDSTIRRRWSALSSFYEFAVDRDALSFNPVLGIDRPPASSADLSPTPRLSAHAVASCRALAAALDPRLDALVALLVSDGLKVGEALALDVGDVAGGSRSISITVRRRGEVKRIILDRESARAIRRCVGERSTGPVFLSERSGTAGTSQRLTRFGADHLIRKLRTDEATDQVTANALRRFHIASRENEVAERDEVVDARGPRPSRARVRPRVAPTR